MSGFVHGDQSGSTTISEITRVRDAISADNFLGCYAYATQSGFRAFELGIGGDFWTKTKSRWLFGIDYGRTDPRALDEIAKRPNAEVRVFDGQFVTCQSGFVPRRDFHPKVAVMKNSLSDQQGIVLGSGNFSFNGLRRSVEAGSAIIATTNTERHEHVQPISSAFEELWKNGCVWSDIANIYATRLADLFRARDENRSIKTTGVGQGFWIEAGYVTKNRKDKPGNQIFAPHGFRRFFGLQKINDKSTLIGKISFITEYSQGVNKNYRENDNKMEKLTLPIPEDHGFGVYDGKVLVFEPKGKQFFLSAIEIEEFELLYGHRLANIERMAGGRRFGELR
jgi:hypothetical protein